MDDLSGIIEAAVADSSLRQKLSAGVGAVVGLVRPTSLDVFPLGVSIGADTPMEAGSLTKPFTALLVADAVLRGEISLETRVDELLFGERWSEISAITVERLATHTSGLPRISMSKAEVLLHLLDPYRTYPRRHVLDYLRKRRPVAPAEPAVSYSNFGYAVLGLMLEKATSQSYEELLQDRMLDPIGMTASGLHLVGKPDRAERGHNANGGFTSVWHFDGYAPCGALVSTLEDLARAAQAFLDPTHPIQKALQLTVEPRAATPVGSVGLAWHSPAGADYFWHNGATFGYTSYLGIDRWRGAGIVILCNQFLASEVTALGHGLMRLIDKSVNDKEKPQ
jgi:CubicO group peptidase (beta-lactamase class C family)